VPLHWVGYLVVLAELAVLVTVIEALAARKGASIIGLSSRGRRLLFIASMGFVVFTWLVYLSRFIVLDFTLKEVAEETSYGMPLFFRIGASWAGGTGSIFLFSMILAAIGLALAAGRIDDRLIAYHGGIVLFGLLYVLLSGGLERASGLPSGLNPLLKSFWLYPHPLATFTSYAFIAAAAVAYAAERRRASRIMAGVGWILLSLGLLLGGVWSYVTFGWGGYWAWDPVETSELLPWLILTAYLHGMGWLRDSDVMLYTSAMSVFFATFMVRTGLSPLHSFAGSTFADLLLLVPAAVFAYPALKGLPRFFSSLWRSLTSRKPVRVALAATVLALGYSHLVVFASLAVPAAIHLAGMEASIPQGRSGVAYYHPLLYPVLVVLMLATPLCMLEPATWAPYIALAAGTLFASVLMVAMTVRGLLVWSPLSTTMTNAMISFALPLAAVAAAAAIYSLFLNAYRRRILNACRALIHIGLAVLVIGILVSGPYAFKQEYMVEVNLKPGHAVDLGGGVKVELLGYSYSLDTKSYISPLSYRNTLPVAMAMQALAALSHIYSMEQRALTVGYAKLKAHGLAGLVDLEGKRLHIPAKAFAITDHTELHIEMNITRIGLETFGGGHAATVNAFPVMVASMLIKARGPLAVNISAGTPLTLDFVNPLVFKVDDYTIEVSEAQLHFFNIYQAMAQGSPTPARIRSLGNNTYLASPVTLIVTNGWIKHGNKTLGVPIQLSTDEAMYLSVKSSEAALQRLFSNPLVAELLKTGRLQRIADEVMRGRNLPLPEKIPETAVLHLKLRIIEHGRSHDVDASIRFDANGELAGIHGLVVKVLPISIGPDNIYVAIYPPTYPNQYGWHDLLLYYLNKTLPGIRDPAKRLGILLAFTAGYLVDVLKQNQQGALQLLLQAAENLYNVTSHYHSIITSEGLRIAVKRIPMIDLVWAGALVMMLGEAATLIAVSASWRRRRGS